MKRKQKIYDPNIDKEQTREFGILAVLVTSFIAFYFGKYNLTGIIFILTLLTLVIPVIFYPFALFWSALSNMMGKISTAVILGIVFFIIVIPIALIRKLLKYDGMNIKQFKKGTGTMMTTRNHIYSDSDLSHIF
ncbi:MAG TPA: SxtJ family membrane protein [Puia sp.]|jgi:predicted membrane metal-binding protein